MRIRRFAETDAGAVSEMIITTLRVSNAGDYSAEEIEELVRRFQPEDIIRRAGGTHFYVAEDDEGSAGIVGCGSIGAWYGREDESGLFTVFVHPEYQGKGIGKRILQTLEKDPYFLRAKRVEVPASITGEGFYRKAGYTDKDGCRKLDESRLYRLEKKNALLFRRMTAEDYDGVYELWMSCRNMGLNNLDDSRDGIGRYLDRNPSTCYIAVEEDKTVGVILAGHDGRRGFIYHLAVDGQYRRRGIASRLLDLSLMALREEGINKTALVVFGRNIEGNEFWESQGFTARDDLVYRNRALTEIVRMDT